MRVVAGLRRRGIDICSTVDDGMLSASDREHLDHASDTGRVVVTRDPDFLRIASKLLTEGAHHPGILFVLPSADVGTAVRGIALLSATREPAHMRDWIEWIS